ncbi:MAG: M23 family metallopeptidase [Myxococcales bacterium]|nr:M23 family metallopeptidase [Myxococcales bacterium]
MRFASRLLLAVVLVAHGLAQAETPDRIRAHCLERLDHEIRRYHLDAAAFDRDAICGSFAEKLGSGLPQRFVEDWLQDRIIAVQFAFARAGAHHDGRARYRYPFEAWIPRLVSQAYGGRSHNSPAEYHSYDFLNPTATKILAARAGTVVTVADGTPEGTDWREDAGNLVRILHKDGTWANYAHLQPGIPVKVGQAVARGQWIANSGNTGFSDTPHLHMTVQRMDRLGEVESVPIRWGRPGGKGFVIEAGRHWGGRPRSRSTIRVSLDGKQGSASAPIPVAFRAEAQLRVERVGSDGAVTDVTADERVRYETMTLWNLHSLGGGRIHVAPVPELDLGSIEEAIGLVSQSDALMFVYYGEPDDLDFGMAELHLRVGGAR